MNKKKPRPICLGCSNTVKQLKCKYCSYKCYVAKISYIEDTKGALFANRKNWQSARSTIQKNARIIYFNNRESPACEICGYTKHVEVAHRKSVSSFDDSCKICEINDPNNLIGFCPNHHWEFDNGILDVG
jgi:hypothetical protein